MEETNHRKRQIAWILTTFAIVLLLDQVTKSLILAFVEQNRPLEREVFFQITHQRNEGLVGGMLSGQRLLVVILPLIATGVLLALFRYLDPAARIQALAYGLVCGGALGNIIDRMRLGSVTDFLQFHFYFIPWNFPWKFYPAFNVADSAICIGVGLLILTWNVSPQQSNGNATSTV